MLQDSLKFYKKHRLLVGLLFLGLAANVLLNFTSVKQLFESPKQTQVVSHIDYCAPVGILSNNAPESPQLKARNTFFYNLKINKKLVFNTNVNFSSFNLIFKNSFYQAINIIKIIDQKTSGLSPPQV